MYIFNKLKKMFLFSAITCFVFSGSLFSNMQMQALSDCISAYVDKIFKSRKIDIDLADFSENLKQKAESMHLDLDFKAEKLNNKSYIFNGHNRITGGRLCKITINDFVVNSHWKNYKSSCDLDPNIDGCIKSSQDGSFFVNKCLEAVFVKNNDIVDIRADLLDVQYFNCCDKNTYKVIQHPSLCQETEGPCGYYAINNLLMAYIGHAGIENILDRVRFEPFYKKLIDYNNGKIKSVSNDEIERIINNNLIDLCKRNVMISIENINQQNCLNEESIRTFGKDNSAIERIKDFQINGTPQYLIICTPVKKEKQDSCINGLKLNWDNSFDRLYCIENHGIALKIEWQDPSRPGKSPVILTIFDSSGPKDSRFAKLIHWYYYVFAHTIV